jgi:speckle-type POZ protein
MFDHCSFTHQFKLNFVETKNVAIGDFVSSPDISAGGHLWRINCYPRGNKKEDKGDYLSIFFELVSKSKDGVKATLEAFVMDRHGALSSSHKSLVHVYPPKKGSDVDNDINDWGWPRFVERSVLESLYVTDGSVIILCGVKVGSSLVRREPRETSCSPSDEVPPSDIGRHLGILLDSAEGSDVSFVVGGKTFPAHRAVLAARSPVFKAQLLGSMADAKMPSITLQDITPATFKAMLRFVYTDDLPGYEGEGSGDLDEDKAETIQDLLAAADRYALDRLKLLCARKLWDGVSTDTIGATLACAETYNCSELRKKCIDYFADEKNFKKAVLTDGFVELVQKFPSILAELRVKVGA